MPAFESLIIHSDGLRLFGGSCAAQSPRGTVVLLHGIPSIAPPDPDDEGYAGFALRFAERGWTALWGDMRGVRRSEGYFSIEGWVRDATAFIERARGLSGAATLPLALVGSSAGGAVAAEAVRRGAPVDGLALLAAPAAWISFAADPIAGARRVQQEAGMAMAPEDRADPSRWAEEFNEVTAERSIEDVKIPTLILHGTADDVVPVEHAHRIASHALEPEVMILEGAPHQLRRHQPAVDAVVDWLDRIFL